MPTRYRHPSLSQARQPASEMLDLQKGRSAMPTSRSHRRRQGGPWGVLLGGVLVVVLGVGVALRTGTVIAAGVVPSATPTLDPQLVIHPRTVPISATLTHGAAIRGTLYPAYPGANTLHITIDGRDRTRAPTASLVLVVTMSGMAMPPIHARLTGHESRYSGVIVLPMFGRYWARVSLTTPDGPITGTVVLPLTFPHDICDSGDHDRHPNREERDTDGNA
jgi:hypothetical protein